MFDHVVSHNRTTTWPLPIAEAESAPCAVSNREAGPSIRVYARNLWSRARSLARPFFVRVGARDLASYAAGTLK